MRRYGYHAIAAAAICGTAAPHSAHAIDCTKAQEPIEIAICSDASTKAADDAMGIAFRALLGKLSGPSRETALDDQRAWIASRNRHCLSHSLPPPACAKAKSIERTAMLTGTPETGPGIPGGLQPVFLRHVSEQDKEEFEAQFFRFAPAKTAGERLLNQEAEAAAKLFEETKRDFLDDKREKSETSKYSYHETWTLRYASPGFLSIWREEDQYSGGAHPTGGASGLNIDLRNGRILKFEDLFEKSALKPIAKLCIKDIARHSGERLADLGHEKPEVEAEPAIGQLTSWSFRASEAEIYFGTGALGDSYAAGTFRCTVPLAALRTLAKGPLPL